MATKTTPEVIRKKELVRYYQSQIIRLARQQRYLLTQLDKIKDQIKDYEKRESQNRKMITRE